MVDYPSEIDEHEDDRYHQYYSDSSEIDTRIPQSNTTSSSSYSYGNQNHRNSDRHFSGRSQVSYNQDRYRIDEEDEIHEYTEV